MIFTAENVALAQASFERKIVYRYREAAGEGNNIPNQLQKNNASIPKE